ncbi:hypothetical protein MMC07_002179 [Pseudocyphellaria aurata]|nr:hypothetical protein [Pseudocyphellaria aurata]
MKLPVLSVATFLAYQLLVFGRPLSTRQEKRQLTLPFPQLYSNPADVLFPTTPNSDSILSAIPPYSPQYPNLKAALPPAQNPYLTPSTRTDQPDNIANGGNYLSAPIPPSNLEATLLQAQNPYLISSTQTNQPDTVNNDGNYVPIIPDEVTQILKTLRLAKPTRLPNPTNSYCIFRLSDDRKTLQVYQCGPNDGSFKKSFDAATDGLAVYSTEWDMEDYRVFSIRKYKYDCDVAPESCQNEDQRLLDNVMNDWYHALHNVFGNDRVLQELKAELHCEGVNHNIPDFARFTDKYTNSPDDEEYPDQHCNASKPPQSRYAPSAPSQLEASAAPSPPRYVPAPPDVGS